METICANSARSKYRHAQQGGNFYPPPYNTHFRQNEYSMGISSRQSALLWQERPQPNSAKSKGGGGKSCSIALAAAAFIVLVAVVSIAGLALYMGALRTDQTNPLLVFSCSVKVLRGDRFVGNLQEKTRKYKNQFEILYQRSLLSPAVIACNIEKFGNDTRTVHFRLTLNKRKIPRSITNIEKMIKDTLISDALSKKPIFKNIRFDSRSVSVKLAKDQNLYQRTTIPKQSTNIKMREPSKTIATLKIEAPKGPQVTKKPEIQEISIEEENLPVIQGSFQISKTEADIAVNKVVHQTEGNTKTDKVEYTTKKTSLKETAVTSAFYKIASIDQVTKPTASPKTPSFPQTIKTSTVEATTMTSKVQTTKIVSTTDKVDEENQSNSAIISPDLINNEPWIPIVSQDSTMPNPLIPYNQQRPTYTSFTNPGLSFHLGESEKLGTMNLMSHPLPVNKLSELSVPESNLQHQTANIINVFSSTTTTSKSLPIFEAPRPNDFIGNVSAFFQSLASRFSAIDAHKNISTPTIEETKTSPLSSITSSSASTSPSTDGFSSGEGQVEVIDADDLSLMMPTTKLPLVTLLPVKSNSGIGRPLRKRPSFDYVENRSFPTRETNQNIGTVHNPTEYVETEALTSINSKVHAVNRSKPKLNDYKIMSVLNFQVDTKALTPDNGIIRNQKTVQENIDDSVIEQMISGVNSSISVHPHNAHSLSPEELIELSEISKLSQNESQIEDVLLNKAVHASYHNNHEGLKVLTKTFKKIPFDNIEKNKDISQRKSSESPAPVNSIECTNYTVKCANGQCLSASKRCNQLIDCEDGADEKNCSCADYLKSQYHLRKICDGVVDCWDYSDENHCDWCTPGDYLCVNSKICINQSKICDGVKDCPQADDERRCVAIASNVEDADDFTYNGEGYLLIRKFGKWGKLCVESSENVTSSPGWNFTDLGTSVCKALTYQNLENTCNTYENNRTTSDRYFKMNQNELYSSLLFEETPCNSKQVLTIKCNNLECGARPQAVKQVARIVGGVNSGLGAWPWQAALYKEGEFQCGATLLSETWLISAGHCFYHAMDEHWVARLGALRRGTFLPSPYEQLRPIIRIVLHPKYVDTGFINDISLLKMKLPVTFSDYVRPICLPKEGVTVQDGTMCTVAGWGQLLEAGRIFPDTLQEVQIPVISAAECRKRTLFLPLYRVTDNMFCAGFERGGRDACLGDSGGPLMCPESDGRWTLQGVTSNGYGCARKDRPGVYTKVSNYVPWIVSHITNHELTSHKNKSVCAGHRCPLGDCLPANRLCNGYIECSDGSDEMHCFN